MTIGKFWEKFLKIVEKMAKEIHLFTIFFQKKGVVLKTPLPKSPIPEFCCS